MNDVIQQYALDAASRGSITELLYLWLPTIYTKDIAIQSAVNATIPSLVNYYKLDVDVSLTFPEFLKEHDRQLYKRAEDEPNKCLTLSASEGNLRGFELAISKGANDWLGALREAVVVNNTYIINCCISKLPDNTDKWGYAMLGAIKGGHFDLMQYFFSKGVTYRRYCTQCAVKNQRQEIIQFLIEKNFFDWNIALIVAAFIDDFELIKTCISMGAVTQDVALHLAIAKWNIPLAKYLFTTGAKNLNMALRSACIAQNFELIKLFLEAGATNFNEFILRPAPNKVEFVVDFDECNIHYFHKYH